MTISELLSFGTNEIRKANTSDTPRLDAEVLLSSVLDCDRFNLILNANTSVSEKHQEHFLSCVNMRKNSTPVAYILGHREFMSLDFSVCPGVLIPRPDTEVLAEFAIDKAKQKKNPIVLDLCTGSGALAISIAKYAENAFVYGLDFSEICVECARKNAKNNGVDNRSEILLCDILKDFSLEKKADILVSNPPYIKTDVIKTLDKTVRDFEPKSALDGGVDGLLFYKRIIFLAPSLLKPGGILAFEIGHDQKNDLASLLENSGLFGDISFLCDLAGISRVVYATLK